jgi:hypothetical protein
MQHQLKEEKTDARAAADIQTKATRGTERGWGHTCGAVSGYVHGVADRSHHCHLLCLSEREKRERERERYIDREREREIKTEATRERHTCGAVGGKGYIHGIVDRSHHCHLLCLSK